MSVARLAGLAAVIGAGLSAACLECLGFPADALADGRPEFSLPLACVPHKTCFIQNYFDHDSGPGARDYACGTASYDTHDGIDFRVLSVEAAKAGVAVQAAADGTVTALRDGVQDVLLRDGKGQDVKGIECGNGVIIDHGQGWETQYCHMKMGSVTVSKGRAVKRGEKLGEVGYSGKADFAHVHFTVRRDGKAIDPFLPDAAEGTCARDAKGPGLWKPSEIVAFPYRNGEIISSGFAGEQLDFNTLEVDHTRVTPLMGTSPALLFYARLMNLVAGDRLRITITGPGGTLVEQLTEPLERSKASYLAFAGKKRRDLPWQAGRYRGQIEIVREGAVTAAAVTEFDLK